MNENKLMRKEFQFSIQFMRSRFNSSMATPLPRKQLNQHHHKYNTISPPNFLAHDTNKRNTLNNNKVANKSNTIARNSSQ